MGLPSPRERPTSPQAAKTANAKLNRVAQGGQELAEDTSVLVGELEVGEEVPLRAGQITEGVSLVLRHRPLEAIDARDGCDDLPSRGSQGVHPAQALEAGKVAVVAVHLAVDLDGVRCDLHVGGQVGGRAELP